MTSLCLIVSYSYTKWLFIFRQVHGKVLREPLRGGWEWHCHCKPCDPQDAFWTRAVRGPWAALTSPKRGSATSKFVEGEGWVSPFGDTLLGGGASEEGIQREKPRRGRSGTGFVCHGVGGWIFFDIVNICPLFLID